MPFIAPLTALKTVLAEFAHQYKLILYAGSKLPYINNIYPKHSRSHQPNSSLKILFTATVKGSRQLSEAFFMARFYFAY